MEFYHSIRKEGFRGGKINYLRRRCYDTTLFDIFPFVKTYDFWRIIVLHINLFILIAKSVKKLEQFQ